MIAFIQYFLPFTINCFLSLISNLLTGVLFTKMKNKQCIAFILITSQYYKEVLENFANVLFSILSLLSFLICVKTTWLI